MIVVVIMAGLIKLISLLIREDREAFQRPIFLMGKGFGALLALLIAAQPPQRDDLALIIVDPGRYIYIYICAKISTFNPVIYNIASPSSLIT